MKHKFFTSLINFLIFAFAANAQEDLSLSQAIQLGLKRNYDIRIEQRNVDVAINNNSWGEAGRYPTISLNLTQGNSINDNIKTASPFQLQDQTISNSISPGVSLNWTLFDGFRVNIAKSRLRVLQEESQGNADIVIANTIQAIILGYYNAVLEQKRLQEFQKQLTLSRDKYAYAKVKSEFGSATTIDVLLEEGNYLTDSTNYINQELAYRNALRQLNVLLNEEQLSKDYNFTDPLFIEQKNYELNDLYEKMNKENVDLRRQYLTQSILHHDLNLRKAERYPSLDLSAGYSHNRSRVDLSNATFPSQDGTSSPGPAEPLSAVTDNYFANFTLSFNLFNGGRINRAIENAFIREDIGNIRIDKLKQSLHADLLQSYDAYNIRKQLYGISVKRYEAATKNLELAEEQFDNGTINSFDFRTVQNNQLSAAILKLQAMFSLIDAHVTLMRLTGGIIETYGEE